MRFLAQGYGLHLDFKKLPLSEFIKCWPDEHNLLTRLLSDPQKSLSENLAVAVGGCFRRLKYKDEPELLAMHACLVDDWDCQIVLRHKGVGWITRNKKEMIKRLNVWYQRNGIWPHPVSFFAHC